MSIYTTPSCSCIHCRKEFSAAGINTHYIRSHTALSKRDSGKGTHRSLLYCSCTVCREQVTVQNLKKHHELNHTPKISKVCPTCQTEHTKEGPYCSRSCSNSRPKTEEYRKRISEALRGRPSTKQPTYSKVSWCKACSNVIKHKHRASCSAECLHTLLVKAGQAAAAKTITRSKDEIALYTLCDLHFAHVTHNDPLFNGWDADILVHDTKQAILWNGPWHYREMGLSKHSLAQVQNRDKIKIAEIIKAGWTPVIFEDRYYTPLEAFNVLISS